MPRAVAFMAALVCLACAVPGAAAAQTPGPRVAFFDYRFTSEQRDASTGIHARILYRHPADSRRKPIPVRSEVFLFPAGMRTDPAVVPPCEASSEELQRRGEAACPRLSRVLGGTGTGMSGLGLIDPVGTEVDGFENGTGLSLLVTVPAFGARFVTRAVRRGRRISVRYPRVPGGPPDGESAVREVDNLSLARTLGRRAYLRTPEVCPRSGHWTFVGTFTFADGVTQHATAASPCTPDLRAPRIRLRRAPRRSCASRSLRVRARIADESRLRRVHLRLDGRLIRETRRNRFRHRVPVRRLRAGRHRLSVIARDIAGNRSWRTVRFRRCRR